LRVQDHTENETIRVRIADDQRMVPANLKMILERDGHKVAGAATTGCQAIGMTLSLKPDVLLPNIRMPNPDGCGGR
jgi:DNA-binding NarL/FixJ family response regulator